MADELVKVAKESARGSFFLISGTAIATAVMAVATILIGRFLGPELYGQYALSFVIPQLLFLVGDLGINIGVTRFAASLKVKSEIARIAKVVKYALVVKALFGLILFALNYAFADWLATVIFRSPGLAFYFRLASISILFQVVFATAVSASVGLDKAEYSAIATTVQALAKTIISIALVLLGFGVVGAILGLATSYVAGAAVGLVLLFFALRIKDAAKSDYSVGEDLKELVRYGMPLYISILVSGFMPQFIMVVLSNFTTDFYVGNYKEATNFAQLMTVLAIPITTALLAAFSKLDSSAEQKIRKFFRSANKYTAMIIIPLTVLIIVFSREIVHIVLGSRYDLASEYLAMYCLVYLLVGLGLLILESFFNGLGKTRLTMTMNLITFITVAVLSPILAMNYGVEGVILAFLIANTAGTVYGSYIARKHFRIRFDTVSLLKIYLISAVSAVPSIALIRLISLPQIVKLAAGGVLYLFIYATLIPPVGIVTDIELQTAMQITKETKLLSLIAAPVIKYEQMILHKTKGWT